MLAYKKAITLAILLIALSVSVPLPRARASVSPDMVDQTLSPGESTSIKKFVTVPSIPPTVDVLLVMDLTGSMGGEANNVKTQMANIISSLSGLPGVDLQMGLVSHEDYPHFYDSNPTCDYASTYGDFGSGDRPFRVDKAISNDFSGLTTAVGAMTIKSGVDGPEAYTRVVWELGQPDSGISFRPGSFRVAVMFLDNVPHDCNLNEGLPAPLPFPPITGVDPGRDEVLGSPPGTGDDLDWQNNAIPSAESNNVHLIVFDSSSDFKPSPQTSFWQFWATHTAGVYGQLLSDGNVFPGDPALPDLIKNKIKEAAAGLVTVKPDVQGCDPLQFTFTPSQIDNVTPGSTVEFGETITVPPGTPSGAVHCQVVWKANGSDIGTERIWITIAQQLKVTKFYTDTAFNPLALDKSGNPKVDVVLANGKVRSTNPGEIMAWVNVTNTDGPLLSIKVNETLPVDWVIAPTWLPPKGAVHVFAASAGTTLPPLLEITDPTTITVTGTNPQTVHLSIPDLSATRLGRALLKGEAIFLETKLDYGLDGTSQSASSYPRNYTDTATASAWSMPSYTGTQLSGSGSGSFIAYAKVLGDVNHDFKVDIFDAALAAGSYDTKLGDARYNANADLNSDGKVNIFDIAEVGLWYGTQS